MLQAQGLSVSVGGRLVVESTDFTVMPKDKVGLVGRNGAGKTSLFKVLGGHAEPFDGKVIRKGGFGYLPQDPRMGPDSDSRTMLCRLPLSSDSLGIRGDHDAASAAARRLGCS